MVVLATDTDTNKKVAIKKINTLFNDLVDAKRILREIKLLRHFKHENIIGLCDLTPSPGPLEELYIVMDFMDTDLHKIIHSSNTCWRRCSNSTRRGDGRWISAWRTRT